jgi:hypothetical protein
MKITRSTIADIIGGLILFALLLFYVWSGGIL